MVNLGAAGRGVRQPLNSVAFSGAPAPAGAQSIGNMNAEPSPALEPVGKGALHPRRSAARSANRPGFIRGRTTRVRACKALYDITFRWVRQPEKLRGKAHFPAAASSSLTLCQRAPSGHGLHALFSGSSAEFVGNGKINY